MLNHKFLFENKNFEEELTQLLLCLCRIPAPSGREEERAEFIRSWLYSQCGISDLCISPQKENDLPSPARKEAPSFLITVDEAKNVLVFIHPSLPGPMPLFMAHTDTVFPDLTELPCQITKDRIASPGVGDDTACAAILMLYLKYYKDQLLSLNKPLLFAFNSCEEGLGNLKGCRRIMTDYGSRIHQVTSFDGGVEGICSRAVGSLRYEIIIRTRGGHSYNDFGNRSSIQVLCALIERLYKMPLPSEGKSTFNVGVISGGTSVNTIAQSCSCLFEYRSDTDADLEWMKQYFLSALEALKQQYPDIRLELTLVGERPCMGAVDPTEQEALVGLASTAIRRISGSAPHIHAASTDCNIPLSLGIPAVCFGGLLGDGVHTREEYVTLPLLFQEARIIEEYLRLSLL